MGIKFRGRQILIAAIAGAVLLFALACNGQPTPAGLTGVPAVVQPPATAASQAIATPPIVADASPATVPASPAGEARQTAPSAGIASDDVRLAAQEPAKTGIRASGQGEASGSPDVAILTLGVESFAVSVAEARSEAAAAMDNVVATLQDAGIGDLDIRTRRFDISPKYTEREVTKCPGQTATKLPDVPTIEPAPMTSQAETDCYVVRERAISGYRVSNGLSVRVRDLESVSNLIDRVIGAGGDLIRFQGVSFTIEDTSQLEEQARAAAVADLKEKAEQLARFSDVDLGQLVSLQEVTDSYSYRPKFAEAFAMAGSADMATPILPGEQTVTVTVEGLFAIE